MKLFKKFTNEKLEKSVLKNITGGNRTNDDIPRTYCHYTSQYVKDYSNTHKPGPTN